MNKKAIIFFFVILFFIFGAWRTGSEIKKTQNLPYENKIFQEKAIVEKNSPNTFGQNVIIKLEQEKISLNAQVPQYPEYTYGDELEVSCTAKAIENPPAGEAGLRMLYSPTFYGGGEMQAFDRLRQ